jgi:hypothetical protein
MYISNEGTDGYDIDIIRSNSAMKNLNVEHERKKNTRVIKSNR